MPLILEQWRGEELKQLCEVNLEDRLKVIGISLVNELKEEDKRIGNINNVSPSPAPPGGPPATVTGRLAGSWTYILEGLVLRVGSPLIYAKFQELGWIIRERKHDTKGNKREHRATITAVPARPTLRPVFLKNLPLIQRILGGK